MKRKGCSTLLTRRALRLKQTSGHPLFLFCLTGDEILRIADISRVSRDDGGKLIGYQRPEVKRHIQEITEYLDSENVIFPNSLILALNSRVKFRQSRGPQVVDGLAEAGILQIPLPTNGENKPAWIVDGQQRALAISRSKRRQLPIPINAFVADEVELQRDQFLRVNNTKPLPRGLITELLPEVSTPFPARLEAKKIPSAVCDTLNSDDGSPFKGLIARPSMPANLREKAVITDTSIIRMIEESLTTPSGCLFPFRNFATGETDFDGIWSTLIAYWTAVKNTFPQAWGKPPAKSRLMHGVGIRAMGRLMDRIMASLNPRALGVQRHVEHELRAIAPLCHWTSGEWAEIGGLPWNELQNVPRHIRMLSNVLLRGYIQRRASAR
jgi:DGQHR domain-containing protein